MGATDYGIAKGNLATQENMTSYEEKEVKSGCCTSCCLI